MKKAVILLVPVFLYSSCKQMIAEMKEMQSFNHIIDSQFNFKGTGIKVVNSESLQVSVYNSGYNDSSTEVKQKIADSIGLIGMKHFHSDKITGGSVLFVHQAKDGILTVSKSDGYQMHLPTKITN